MTTIFEAIKANDSAKLREILAANPEAINEQWKSNLNWLPIHFAADCNADMEIFNVLFEYKADINTRQTNWDCNVLEIALRTFPMAKIERFLALGAEINKHRSYILSAACNPDADVIRYFLDRGEPFDITDWFCERTPAFYAACNPNVEVLQALIDRGANLKGMDSRGLTIIHFVAQNGSNPEVIKILLDHGFGVDEPDRWGQTPLLHAAGYARNAAMVKVLLEMGADPLKKNSLGNTPLKLANTKEKKEILRLAEWVAKGKDPAKLPKPKRRHLPKPRTAPKPLKLARVELSNSKENINDCPIPEKARFFKDCTPEELGYTNPELMPDLSGSYQIAYFDLTDHDLVTLVDYLDGLESSSILTLVLHRMKQMVISGGLDEYFLCWINLEENRDSFANLANPEAEGEEPVYIGNAEGLDQSEFDPCQLSDRKTILKVAQYYAQKGKPDPKFEWDYDT